MTIKVNAKEADAIIKALEGGVVPRRGIKHLLVGRSREVQEIISIFDKVAIGESDVRFWVGDFGSGKSFMLRTIESVGLERNFIVSTIDLTPMRRFAASDGKAKELYKEIVNNITIQSCQNGNALNTLLQEWIDKLMEKVSVSVGLSKQDLLLDEHKSFMIDKILEVTSSLSSTGLSYEFAQAIIKYYEGIIQNNQQLKLIAMRWLRGDVETKTESKKELGITKIINDDNWYQAIKTLSELFANLGYAGFVINFDEMVNLYKIAQRQTREKNYEVILNIFNECKTNEVKHLFVNFGTTRKTVFDEYRGLVSYGALKGRLGDEQAMDSKLINTNRSVLGLKPLNNEEIYTLLSHLIVIYNTYYRDSMNLAMEDIHLYMEEQLNRPGADEFLTPRAVIKEFIEVLDLARQNKEITVKEIILHMFGGNALPVEKDINNMDNDIEVF